MKDLLHGTKRLLQRGGLRVFGGGQTYKQRVLSLNPLAYWPLDEAAGTSGAGSVLDVSGHSYNATPNTITFGATGIGDGKTAATFNGVNAQSRIDLLSAPLIADFDYSAFTMSGWARFANAGVLSDGTADVLLQFRTASGHVCRFQKNAGNLDWTIVATGGVKNYAYTWPISDANWHHYAFSFSLAHDSMLVYVDGVLNTLRGTIVTGLGAFAGAVNTMTIGCDSNNTNVWNGDVAHIAIWDRELTGQEVYRIGGLNNTPAATSFFALGDSKVRGESDSTPPALGFNGWVYQMTQLSSLTENPYRSGVGGWKVSLYAPVIGDVVKQSGAWIPSHIWVNLGVNELADAPLTPATWQANLGTIVDALHARWPDAPVYIDRVHRDDGAENGQETDMNDTWIPAVIAAGRSAWCHLGIDERLILVKPTTFDGLHPNHAGHVALAQAKLALLGI